MDNNSNKSFITNKNQLLKDVINNILPKSNSVDILVGYFYFSGYQALTENLKDKHVRILVGMDIDTTIHQTFQEIARRGDTTPSRNQIKEEYYSSLIKVINETNAIDTAEGQEIFKQFLSKILDGSLQIKKTNEPCHAKMYLFSYSDAFDEGGNEPGTVITGSSNLSYAGLEGRYEINVRCKDSYAYHDASEVFEELWRSAVPVVNKEVFAEFKDLVLEHVWYEKLYNPYLMYLRVIHEYFSISTRDNILTPRDITRGQYHNLKYQTDAVKMAINAVDNHNGVIISDVVGLGKSIIASTVAKNIGLRTIIIAPPHLCMQWEDYMEQFDLGGKVFSSGTIKVALDYYRRHSEYTDKKFLIIVDEAHRYRNEYTEDYTNLHDLCQDNKVILLTATPFNNRPSDIFSMLKLFQVPSASTLNTVDDLGESFRYLIAKYQELNKEKRNNILTAEEVKKGVDLIAKEIRTIISPLVIRRSRIDLMEIPEYRKDLQRQGIEVMVPEAPEEKNYSLGLLHQTYRHTLECISPENIESITNENYFKAARYSPVAYIREECQDALEEELLTEYDVELNLLIGRQVNTAKFMRRLLVSRFESSIYALQQSINYMISSYQNIIRWIEEVGKIPVYKKGVLPSVEDFYESSDEGYEEITEAFEKYTEKGFFMIKAEYLSDEYLQDLQSDLKLLKDIRNDWFSDNNKIEYDPKLKEFKAQLVEMLRKEPNRKIIVFSSYADTVDYLGRELSSLKAEYGFGVLKYTSSDASATVKEIIARNFDAGIPSSRQLNDFQVLIATDAISEGYNLHRAGAIFNYDIPYNPTRVIQRIGRINRVNKKVFDKLYIYNFFPTEIGEKETRTKEISTLKMAMIHAIMGEDTRVLTQDEEVQAFFTERYKQEMGKTEVESWDSKYRKLLDEVKGTEAYDEALEIPYRARTGRKVEKEHSGVIVLGKKGKDYIFKMLKNNEVTSIPIEEALAIFEASIDEPAVKLTDGFDEEYQTIKAQLFTKSDKSNDKRLSVAIDKVKGMIHDPKLKAKGVSKEYFKDLLRVLQADGLSGYEVRLINKLKPDEFEHLPEMIGQNYLDRIINVKNSIDGGKESLILAEEIIK